MKIFGLLMMALGAYLAYSGYKKKFINTKEGQTAQDVQREIMSSDPNAAIGKALGIGCAGYLKVMSIALGFGLFLIGLMCFLLF
jgi:hypothetical protein